MNRQDAHQPTEPCLSTSPAHPFLAQVVSRLEWIEQQNCSALDCATELVWRVIASDSVIHVAGTGHSTLFALEAFFRAGGLAPINPIWHPMLLPLHGARTSTLAERLDGLGSELVRLARVGDRDLVVVFSHSGVNPVPVEIAEASKASGASVVGILSLDHSRSVSSRHRHGLRLADIADVVIDTGGPVGDACYVAAPGARAIAPLSTILGAFIWDSILVRLADRAAAADVELPVWLSANVPDGDATAQDLTSRFVDRIWAL